MITSVTDRTGGNYTHDDLNRVSSNINYLAGLLNGYGYSVAVNVRTDWTRGDVPRAADVSAYIGSVAAIKARFYGTTAIPAAMDYIGYADANNIELLLLEIENYITKMTAAFHYCGARSCGQGAIL